MAHSDIDRPLSLVAQVIISGYEEKNAERANSRVGPWQMDG
jgi:hypothetical protein